MNKPVFLISHRGALGDFLLTWPVLIALRKKFKNHKFVGFGRPEYLDFAGHFQLFDEAHDCESSGLLSFYSGDSVPESIQPLEYALCWMNKNGQFEAMLARNELKSYRIAPPAPSENKRHAIDFHLDALPVFNTTSCIEKRLYLPFSSETKPQTLIHPGSGSRNKNFEPEFYLFVANELINKNFPDVKFIIGPGERDIKDVFAKQYEIIEPVNVLDLAAVIAGSHFYLGNDSGVSHLSAILGVRTIALFKNTDPSVWGVTGIQADNIEAQTEAQAMAKIQKLF